MHITEAREHGNVVPIRPSPNGCTGNCNQGRACDCVADIEQPPEPMSEGEQRLLVLIYTVSAGLSLTLLVWLWRTFA